MAITTRINSQYGRSDTEGRLFSFLPHFDVDRKVLVLTPNHLQGCVCHYLRHLGTGASTTTPSDNLTTTAFTALALLLYNANSSNAMHKNYSITDFSLATKIIANL